MTARIFIDGEHGTTGLQIRERLGARDDLDLLSLAHGERRSLEGRTQLLREADIAILCLPDNAARQSVELAVDAGTRMIDASTAHRTAENWVFGFAEIVPGHSKKIASAKYVSNPGCYSTGSIALINPLVKCGLMKSDHPITINAVSGYSGGGKGLIAQMEDDGANDAISSSFFSYSMDLNHKHIPEIITRCGLDRRPIFTPSVGRFAQGMLVQIPLFLDDLGNNTKREDIHEIFASHYEGQEFVSVVGFDESDLIKRLDPEEMVGSDEMRLFVFGARDGREVNLIASLDNLGKGASGAAVQNLDLMLGC
ncbi:MAG: N-acetyl-gamma-glutamyl-phosphate reductase [Hyphomicrobiales bacterium]|nr:N-acetyl-gamma-glutamyl-phosphate reductase [Hyphomicrobiales bacterium]